jgi:DNA (cytosine-5)-methyltransferase 1
MKVIELFAGIGGFRLGLERSGHEIVWANEWLEKPRSIYQNHFKEEPNGQDIRTVTPLSIPKADLICGGFPCATFSIAGKRTGFSEIDTKGTLFFEICRIAEFTRTPYIFLENVKGLLNHDDGKTFAIILFSLDKLGYDVQWEVLNSRDFGVAQNRERVFFIGNLRGHPRPKVFPIGTQDTSDVRSHTEEQAKGEWVRNSNSNKEGQIFKNIEGERQGSRGTSVIDRLKTPRIYTDIAPTGTARYGTGGNNVPYLNGVRAVLTPEREEKRQKGRRFKEDGEPMYTLGVQDKHGVAVGGKIRRLTPLECERLQGLPDNYTKYYHTGKLVADSERYERCGRTVTIPVIEEIGKRLHNFYK